MKVIRLQSIRSTRSLRFLPLRPVPKSFSPHSTPITYSRSSSQQVLGQTEDADMAPKGQKFELKTPKGTKDCEYAPLERATAVVRSFCSKLIVRYRARQEYGH